jgi:DNA-binding NarL/FixJ family response regulator
VTEEIRVLIVDDQFSAREGLKALLAFSPRINIVSEASNGQEAVLLMRQCQPDVVLMDARMPLMDGLEATRLIKEQWPQIKVIVLTLFASYRKEALAAGADHFVLKGDPSESLQDLILSLFPLGDSEHGQ